MSLHRACCCDPCPSELTMDLVGIDASKCACFALGPQSQETSFLAVDGTYVIPYDRTITISGRPVCIYSTCYDTGGVIGTILQYSDSVCGGAPFNTINISNLLLSITVYQESGKIRSVAAALPPSLLNCSSNYQCFNRTYTYPGEDFGVAITNPLVCNISGNAASGGTIEVNR